MRFFFALLLITTSRKVTSALLLLTLVCTCASAQKILLLENAAKSQAARIYEGEELRFRMTGDKFWQKGYIREMRPDIQALVINDRFIMLEEVDAIDLGSTFGKVAGYSLMSFGTVWTGIGLIGYNTDGDRNSQISRGELAVGAGSFAGGWLLNKFFGNKRFKVGKFKRLRVVDVSF